MEGECFSTGSFNNHDHLQVSFHGDLLALLTDHGGEGEREKSIMDVDVGRWCGDDGVVSVYTAAISKQRLHLVVAILWPKGWPRHARACVRLELLLPPVEDLLQSQCGSVRSCYPKW
jgi:hypothetical protein